MLQYPHVCGLSLTGYNKEGHVNNPGIKDLVLKALSMGLPMPLNWEQDDELTDSASPEEQESVQAEDDPDDKEVLDCGSQTTEDCHGGLEATRSIEDSPSVAENGQEDRDSDQTENGGEGEDGQEDRDSDQTGGEGEGDAVTDKVAALLNALRERKEQAEDPEMVEWAEAEKRVTEAIVHICEQDCGRIKNAPTSWDTRAMSRDVAVGRWDRVLRDKKWSYRPRNLVVFWDQSGSCDSYISAVHNALKTVAELGYRCTLFDASNGIEEVESVVWTKTGPNQTTEDYYQNGPRLKKVAKNIGAKTDKNIICPSIADFIQICEKADVVIVLQDYDCVQPLFEAASKVSGKKCPHFIDLETRYSEPCEHDWNPDMYEGQEYPVPDRWHRIWSDRGTD